MNKDLGLLVLRLTLGLTMAIGHGIPKMAMLSQGTSVQFADPIGVGPFASLLLIVFAEVFAALFVAAGLFTRLSGIIVGTGLLVAAFVIHGANTFYPQFMPGPSVDVPTVMAPFQEYAFIYGMGFYSIAIMGAGKFSIDSFISRKGFIGRIVFG